MMWLFIFLLAGLALGFYLGSGVGYNTGLAERLPEAEAVLAKVEAERRRIRNLTVSARRAAGDL